MGATIRGGSRTRNHPVSETSRVVAMMWNVYVIDEVSGEKQQINSVPYSLRDLQRFLNELDHPIQSILLIAALP